MTKRIPTRENAASGEYYDHNCKVYLRDSRGPVYDDLVAEAFGQDGLDGEAYEKSCAERARRIASLLNYSIPVDISPAERVAAFSQTAENVHRYRGALLVFDSANAPSQDELRPVSDARKQVSDGILFLMKNSPELLLDVIISTCAGSEGRIGLRHLGVALLSVSGDVL